MCQLLKRLIEVHNEGRRQLNFRLTLRRRSTNVVFDNIFWPTLVLSWNFFGDKFVFSHIVEKASLNVVLFYSLPN